MEPFFVLVFFTIFLYSLKLEHMGCDETKTKAGDKDGKEKIYKRYESENR